MTVFEQWAKLPQKQPRAFTSVVLFLVVALTWVIYSRTTRYEYLDWDDNTLVEQNILVTDPSWHRTWEMFVPHRIPGPHLPLRSTSYRVDLHVFGKRALASCPPAQREGGLCATRVKANYIHITNVWLYALNGVLLFFLMRRLLNPWAAAIGALIWIAHPVHVEGVSWVSGRKEMLSGAFIFGGLLLYIAGTERLKKAPANKGVIAATVLVFATIILHKIWEAKFQGTPFVFGLTSLALLLAAPFAYAHFTNASANKPAAAGMHATSVLFTLCAMLSKPVSIAIPPILLFWELGYRPNRPTPEEDDATRPKWFPKLPSWLPTWTELTGIWARIWPHTAIVLWGMYMTYERGVASQVVKDNTTWNAAPKDWRISSLSALWMDVYHLVAPLNLAPLYDLKSDKWYPAAFAGLAILVTLPVLIVWVLRKSPKSLLWIGFFVWPILPVAGFIPIAAAHADRYLYLPAVTIAAALGVLLATAAFGSDEETGAWERWLAAGLSVAIVGGFSVLSIKQTRIWGFDSKLWEQAVKLSPDLPSARNNYGAALMNAGIPTRPCEPAREAAKLGLFGKTVHVLKHGFGNAPAVIDNCIYGGALEQYYRAYALLPSLDVAQFNIAATEFRLGRPDRAEKYCEEFIAQHPEMPTGFILCGQIKQARAKQLGAGPEADGKLKEAADMFAKGCDTQLDEFAILQKMDKVNACNALAIARANLNDVDGALLAFEKGVTADPQNVSIHLNRIRYYRQLKRFDEALANLDLVSTFSGNHIEVMRGYAVTLLDLGQCDRALEYLEPVIRSPRVTQADLEVKKRIDESKSKGCKPTAGAVPAGKKVEAPVVAPKKASATTSTTAVIVP